MSPITTKRIDYIRLMRLVFGYALVVSVVFVSGYSMGFKRGRSAGYNHAASLHKSSGFVASFQTLRHLRAGEITNGVSRLEAFCFSMAADLFEAPDDLSRMTAQLYKNELKKYRETYATPPNQQYPTERRLDTILKRP